MAVRRKTRPQKTTLPGRLDYACSKDELRPSMNHIFVDDGNFIATNGHILVMIPFSYSLIEEAKLKLLEGYLIHRVQWIDLVKYDLLDIKNPGEIIGYKSGFKNTFHLKKSATDFKFPEYKAVMPSKEPASDQKLSKIDISTTCIYDFTRCLNGVSVDGGWLSFNGCFEYTFYAQNKAIILTPNQEEFKGIKGLIMPVMLNNYV